MSVSGIGGNSGSHTPSTSTNDISGFKDGLKGKSVEELRTMLNDPKLTLEQRKAVVNEIVNRPGSGVTQGAVSDGSEGAGGKGLNKEILALLQKAMSGKASEAEIAQLKDMLQKAGFGNAEIDRMMQRLPQNVAPPSRGGSGNGDMI